MKIKSQEWNNWYAWYPVKVFIKNQEFTCYNWVWLNIVEISYDYCHRPR